MKNNSKISENGREKSWWSYSVERIAQELRTNTAHGLTSHEAAERFKKFGANQLPEQKVVSPLIIFLRQFSSLLVWVLVGALIITAVLGQWIDALAIGAIVFLNAVIGFFQEYKAERSLAALKKLTKPSSRVIREGQQQSILSSMIVPGDIVILESGDIIPADGRVVYTAGLATQEAALTGESTSIAKKIEPLPDAALPLGDRINMAFMGTIVVAGKGHVLVTETGAHTQLGGIASLLREMPEEKTPLELQLQKLGYQLLVICGAVIVLVFVIGLLRRVEVVTMVLTSLSLAVAAIPEGLPAVMTIALAIGVHKMAQRHAIIRRLSCVETLGCATVICADKTGTLTHNKMTVRSIWVDDIFLEVTGVGYTPEGDFKKDGVVVPARDNPDLMMALTIAVLANAAEIRETDGAWQAIGDPTEGALLTVAGKAGLVKAAMEKEHPLVVEVPFSSERKYMSMVRDTPRARMLFLKGAVDVVLARSQMVLMQGKDVPLTDAHKPQIIANTDAMARTALRVLALAYRQLGSGNEKLVESDAPNLENELVFVALVGMIDPPRPEVQEAIKTCTAAGIKTVMITGDHQQTALAIARELGLIDGELKVLTGDELDQLSDEEFKEQVRSIAVYARVSAEHKMRIIRAFKSWNEIVAMTGDGVNDAPAIKAADIGIAMGIMGTEVTKQASDMIIADDNFASIVNAIEEGRGIYDNIVKFVSYLVSTNIAELLVIVLGAFVGFTDQQGNPFIALVPIQLLWMNLITDGLPAIALGVDPVDPHIMQRSPRDASQPILTLFFVVQLLGIGILIAAGTLVAGRVGLARTVDAGHTMALTTLVVLEFVRIYLIRRAYHVGIFSNLWLIGALLSSVGLQLAAIYIPALQTIFKMAPLGMRDWVIIGGIAGVIWLLSELFQALMNTIRSRLC